MTMPDPDPTVALALAEDVGSGDLTAALIPETAQAEATVISREQAILCGAAWFDAVFRQLDPRIAIKWRVTDGDRVEPNQLLCALRGPARALLTGERTALNFLQPCPAPPRWPASSPTPWPAPAPPSSTPGKLCPVCGWPRSTPSVAVAVGITASACSMPC